MIMRAAWLMLVLGLAACSTKPRIEAIPAVAEQRQCPAYPLPPANLLKPPAKTDFLTPSSPPSRRSSSTS